MTPQLLNLFSRYNVALADYETAAVLRQGDYLAAGEAALADMVAIARDMVEILPTIHDPFLRFLLLGHISQATNNTAPATCRDVSSVRPATALPDEMDTSPDVIDTVPDVMAFVGAWPATPAPGWSTATSFCNCKGASAPQAQLAALLAALRERAEQFTPFDPAPWGEALAATLALGDNDATRLAEAISAAAPILLLGLPELAEPMRIAARLLPAPAAAALLHLITSKTRLLALAA